MPEEMANFEQCFLTGSAAEVTPVSEIGDYRFTPGEITKTLMDDYRRRSAARAGGKVSRRGLGRGQAGALSVTRAISGGTMKRTGKSAHAQAGRDEQMPPALHDMAIGEALAVSRGDDRASDEGQPDLPAMRMSGQRQGNRGRHAHENIRLMRQENDADRRRPWSGRRVPSRSSTPTKPSRTCLAS